MEEIKNRADKVIEHKKAILNQMGKLVRHFKGNVYMPLFLAENTEFENQPMMIYRAVYGDCTIYARPFDMFCEEVPEGKPNPTGQKYRFEPYEAKSVK